MQLVAWRVFVSLDVACIRPSVRRPGESVGKESEEHALGRILSEQARREEMEKRIARHRLDTKGSRGLSQCLTTQGRVDLQASRLVLQRAEAVQVGAGTRCDVRGPRGSGHGHG